MSIEVSVRKDPYGFYPNGYNKLIPLDIRIVGMVTQGIPGQPGTEQELLRIEHPSFSGWLGVAETEESIADRINAALCCGSSAAAAQLAPPTISGATAGPLSVTVPFSLVTDATGYQVQVSIDNFATIAGSTSGSSSPLTVLGLTNGQAYKRRVRATAPGFTPSDWATDSNTYTPAALPTLAAPTFGTITPGTGQLSALLNAVSNATTYTVQASTNGFTSIAGTASASGVGSAFVITGLTAGVSYQLRAFATAVGYAQSPFTVASGTYAPTGANQAPVASLVTISGTQAVGQTLTRTYDYSDNEGDLEGASTTQWYRSNDDLGTGLTAISGATSSTYVLQSADLGKKLKATVTPVAATGTSPGNPASSEYTGFIVSAPVTGYYLIDTTNATPTNSQILAGTPFTITPGADYTITFGSTGWLKVFEPSTEPVKVKNHDAVFGDDPFGPSGTFGTGITVSSFRGYISQFQTGPATINFNQ